MKKEKTHKIVFDSNKLWINANRPDDNFGVIFSSHIAELLKFIHENGLLDSVQISVPEVSIQERVQQRFEELREVVDRIGTALKKLEPLKVSVKPSSYKKSNYRNLIMKKAMSYLKENNIETIKTISLKGPTLIKRAYTRKPPFCREDKGFKDTLIWMSIIAEAKRNRSIKYLILSANNSDFNFENLQEELKKEKLNNFEFFTGIQEVQEYLDRELVLNLKLKERNNGIEKEIKEHTGDIMVQLNRFAFQYFENKKINSSSLENISIKTHIDANAINYPMTTNQALEEYFSGYNFLDITISNIKEAGNNIFDITATVKVEDASALARPRLFNSLDVYSDNLMGREVFKEIQIIINYNRDNKKITVNPLNRNWYWKWSIFF